MLDTLKIADALRDAGFDERQARAIADVQKQAVEEGGLATKTDIVSLESKIDALAAKTNALAAQLRMLPGVVFAISAILAAIFVKIFLG